MFNKRSEISEGTNSGTTSAVNAGSITSSKNSAIADRIHHNINNIDLRD
jgi:hypothetical protein